VVRSELADSLKTPRSFGVRTFTRLPNVQDFQHSDAVIVETPFDTAPHPGPGLASDPEGAGASRTSSTTAVFTIMDALAFHIRSKR
jgi:hypothetical protein